MRKEIPLFDINPRTTMEFLERARAGTDSHGVTFQQTQEQFTQWKEEEQEAIKAEQAPEGPPTSFAQALLRKLNFHDGSDANGTKGLLIYLRLVEQNPDSAIGSSKPRLVARSTSPKSPWKYHKVPTISTNGVSPALKPLFSCMLWRLHEFENNPLMPEKFVLLSDDYDTRALAQKLNVPVKSTADLRKLIKQIQSDADHRAMIGELEKEFNIQKPQGDKLENGSAQSNEKPSTSVRLGFEVEPVLEQDEEIEELKKTISHEKVLSNGAAGKPDRDVSASMNENGTTQDLGANPGPSVASAAPPTVPDSVEDATIGSEMEANTASGGDVSVAHQPITPPSSPPGGTRPNQSKESGKPTLESPTSTAAHEKDIASASTDESDDEEVIVFKPRSRRTSGLPKSAGDSSRPSTADGARRPWDGDQSKKLNIPQMSTPLKPQSPVFVPRSLHSAGKHQSQLSNESVIKAPDLAPVETLVQTQDEAQPVVQQQRRTPNLHTRRSEGLAQRQSRDIIERQREAIQRQTEVQAKPAPRQIQMEPTSSPTVIDPDAFDRSYVVQPRNAGTANGTNGNHRPPHPRGSPRRVPRTPEPDVDFVLKSGSPRASTRGRGKLWVP